MIFVFMGILLFISLVSGGTIALLAYEMFHQKFNRALGLLCGLLLVGLLVFEIIPESLESYEKLSLLLGFIIGYFFYSLTVLHSHNEKKHVSSMTPLIFGLFLHTIPLSLTLGSLLNNQMFPIAITTYTILHHIPEGFALTSLFLLRKKKLMSLLVCFLSLSVCSIFFMWIGKDIFIAPRIQGVLIGISICLIGLTSWKEFIFPSNK